MLKHFRKGSLWSTFLRVALVGAVLGKEGHVGEREWWAESQSWQGRRQESPLRLVKDAGLSLEVAFPEITCLYFVLFLCYQHLFYIFSPRSLCQRPSDSHFSSYLTRGTRGIRILTRHQESGPWISLCPARVKVPVQGPLPLSQQSPSKISLTMELRVKGGGEGFWS